MSFLCPWCDESFPESYQRYGENGEIIKDLSGPRTNFKSHIDKCKKMWDKKQKQYQRKVKK